MSLLLNGSPLPSDIREPCFPCSASVGHTEVPFQGRRGQSRIRTHPYTPNARGHELKAEMSRIGCEIRFLMAGSGVLGAQGVGGIRGDTATAEFLDFQSGNEAVVNTESGRR